MIELSANDPVNDNPNFINEAAEAIKRLIKSAQISNEDIRNSSNKNRRDTEHRIYLNNDAEKGSGSGD